MSTDPAEGQKEGDNSSLDLEAVVRTVVTDIVDSTCVQLPPSSSSPSPSPRAVTALKHHGTTVVDDDDDEDDHGKKRPAAGGDPNSTLVVDVVAATQNSHMKDKPPDEKSAEAEDHDDDVDSVQPGPAPTPASTTRKLLMRADFPKLAEQYRASLQSGGRTGSEAALQLATFYHYGIGVKQDDAEAARLYEQGLQAGALDAAAAFQLGLIYNQGAPPKLPASPERAVRWWTVSASLGNAVAMYNLGVMLINGLGCDMDPDQAMRWFAQAKALNPELSVPNLTRAQFDQRLALADKLKRQRQKQAISPEERERRKQEALDRVHAVGRGALALGGLTVGVIALRYWWRNRL